MPSKKRKYNARFPAGRIKKIMQTDEDVGKVAQAVPVIISRTLELFVESLLTKAMQITNAKNAKTLSPSHMKQCILSENRFDFLKDLVKNIPDINNDDEPVTPTDLSHQYSVPAQSLRAKREQPVSEEDLAIRNIGVSTSFPANFYTEQQSTSNTTSVIQYSPKTSPPLSSSDTIKTSDRNGRNASRSSPPPLIPVAQQSTQPSMYNYNSSNAGELCIDEDYDN